MSDRFVALLRHGEVAGGHRFRGPSNDALSAGGRRQLESVFARDDAWSDLFASPSRRCREPAAALAERLGIPLIVEPNLAERGFGTWSGREVTELPESDLLRFYADPTTFTPPGAEPLNVFTRRVRQAWCHLLGRMGGNALVLTHGGVIRVIIAEVLQIPPACLGLIEVPYACLTRLRVPDSPGRPSMISHGALD